ncbi:MAG: type I-F CRISPR-associated protein Csy2 [Bacteroidetes bacterium]|nr:type I-F CRISPR-associated protein Csy2 [Bacteroidota bacterium]
MSSAFIIFERIDVQDANCIAGFTYGFPSITHFLGFGHALSRKLFQSRQLHLQGCAVICHQHQIHAYQSNRYGDYVFAQSKNPPILKKHASSTPPIVEEGKMNMIVSLIMECPDFTISRQTEIGALKQKLMSLAFQHHLAGGSIQRIQAVHVLTDENDFEEQKKQMRQIKRVLLPGFVLMDRTDLLSEYYQQKKQNNPEAEFINAWLDFSAMKYQAKPLLKENETEPNDNTKAEWLRLDKPAMGWLVPITNGYKAISPVYPPGEVANTRNPDCPFCFVEVAHGLGEWRSLHRIKYVSEILWQYHYEPDWYLCRQGRSVTDKPIKSEINNIENEIEDDFLSSL